MMELLYLQYNTVTIQYNTTQHSTAQHSTAQHSTAQHSTAQHSTAQHSTAQHSTAQHSTAQHSTAQHSTAQHSTAQHNTIPYNFFNTPQRDFFGVNYRLHYKNGRKIRGVRSAMHLNASVLLLIISEGGHDNYNVCCGLILSLVQILFSFVLNSLSYITIPKNKGK